MKNQIILNAQNLSVSFGGICAVQNVSFSVARGETVALIGSNGAGKTTVFHILTGYTKPDAGRFFLCGKEITHKTATEIAARGISRTFQNIRLFSRMTVLENVQIALEAHRPLFLPTRQEDCRLAWQLLETYGLSSVALQTADALPYGKKRRLELVRALATNPKLLLLDEPAAGLNTDEKQELMLLLRIISRNLPILFIEHDISFIRCLCDRVIAMHRGQVISDGTPEIVLSHPAVTASYTGGTPC